MPGHSSNPESKLRMRLVPALRITATWSASREDNPLPVRISSLAARTSGIPNDSTSSATSSRARKAGSIASGRLIQGVPVDYLLVHLHACDQPFPIPYQLSEKRKGTVFVGVRGANQVHGHIGVYEDH